MAAVSQEGWSALLMAADKELVPVVNVLLDAGANVNHQNKVCSLCLFVQYTSLSRPSSSGAHNCDAYLILRLAGLAAVTYDSIVVLPVPCQKNVTALHLAALRKNSDIVDVLLHAGADRTLTTDVRAAAFVSAHLLVVRASFIPRCPWC